MANIRVICVAITINTWYNRDEMDTGQRIEQWNMNDKRMRKKNNNNEFSFFSHSNMVLVYGIRYMDGGVLQ